MFSTYQRMMTDNHQLLLIVSTSETSTYFTTGRSDPPITGLWQRVTSSSPKRLGLHVMPVQMVAAVTAVRPS
ncbi:salicylate hydroxylase [Moniliophthora roreri]|nr:salicylate hydroxylase [Moniliophthora roreri]